jgi:histone acetyltransferase (RNA polymerase elongator complex component)
VERFLATADASPTPFGAREIAFFGGTFTGLPAAEQERLLELGAAFVRDGRVACLRVSTHPSLVDPARLALLARFPVKVVELGVQSADPEVLHRAGRDYDRQVIQRASLLVREAGFTLGHQLMVGLPGASAASDLDSARFCASLGPALARLYPTLVLRGTGLEADLLSGAYQPLGLEEALERTAAMLAVLHQAGVEVIRVGVHPDTDQDQDVLAGPRHPGFGYLALGRSYLRRLESALQATRARRVRITLPERDRGAFLGPDRRNQRLLASRFPDIDLLVAFRPGLRRGQLLVEPVEDT